MQYRFEPSVAEVLVKSGWFSGRSVETLVKHWKIELMKSDSLQMFPAAEKALLEFGGIKCSQRTMGKDLPVKSFEVNPSLAVYEEDRLEEFSSELGIEFYPLGEASGGYYFLAIAEDGKVYWLMENLFLIGKNFDEALHNMIIGVKPKLMMSEKLAP